jgi:hypothetical protein
LESRLPGALCGTRQAIAPVNVKDERDLRIRTLHHGAILIARASPHEVSVAAISAQWGLRGAELVPISRLSPDLRNNLMGEAIHRP